MVVVYLVWRYSWIGRAVLPHDDNRQGKVDPESIHVTEPEEAHEGQNVAGRETGTAISPPYSTDDRRSFFFRVT